MTDSSALWQDDFVGFALGCSFSFETALIEAGVPLRHQEIGMTVPMYRTNIETTPAGPFRGPMVVSMRPFAPADAIRAIAVTSRCNKVHGAPVHFGDPAAIGIADIDQPSWAKPLPIRPGEVPLFWACGVTPQVVVEAARPPIAISHKPGPHADHRPAERRLGGVRRGRGAPRLCGQDPIGARLEAGKLRYDAQDADAARSTRRLRRPPY